MDVQYKEGAICVVPVRYYHELERSVRMIADSEEKLANSFLSLHPPDNPRKDVTDYFARRGWTIIATPA